MSIKNLRLIDVGILIFDDFEILDATGPISVFNAAKIPGNPKDEDPNDKFSIFYNRFSLFNTKLISVYDQDIVKSSDGTKVIPDYLLSDLQTNKFNFKPFILVIPGGKGIQPVRKDKKFIQWLTNFVEDIEITLSVCTGAYALAETGLLDTEEMFTTHWAHSGFLDEEFPHLSDRLALNARYVDNGTNIITSAGVSSGIDGALRVVARLVSDEVAERVAKRIEYPWLG